MGVLFLGFFLFLEPTFFSFDDKLKILFLLNHGASLTNYITTAIKPGIYYNHQLMITKKGSSKLGGSIIYFFLHYLQIFVCFVKTQKKI